MKYDVKICISYDYDRPAVGGRHLVCLMPQDLDHTQQITSATLHITPDPAERLDRRDFFGNHLTEFSFRGPHDRVMLTLTAQLWRADAPPCLGPSASLTDLPRQLALCRDVGPQSPLHFLAASTRVPRDADMAAFARSYVGPDATVAETVLALGNALHTHMTFDATATTVDTPAAEAFAKSRGVCQDFSHIMIACLRSLGIPAGYVSGLLRTLPPPGKPRLEGSDAMHAWVRAWCGETAGWLEFDPTNASPAGGDHIVVAYGRDYSDVAPVKGMMRTSGSQKSQQAVDVIPL